MVDSFFIRLRKRIFHSPNEDVTLWGVCDGSPDLQCSRSGVKYRVLSRCQQLISTMTRSVGVSWGRRSVTHVHKSFYLSRYLQKGWMGEFVEVGISSHIFHPTSCVQLTDDVKNLKSIKIGMNILLLTL